MAFPAYWGGGGGGGGGKLTYQGHIINLGACTPKCNPDGGEYVL